MFDDPVGVAVPAIVHGWDLQPLVAEYLKQQGRQMLAGSCGIDRCVGEYALERINDVRGVLKGVALRGDDHRNYGPADPRQDDLFVHLASGGALFVGNALVAQVRARLAREVGDLASI